MANNVEKFVVDLGFSQKDLNKLKELLRLQDKANKVSKQEQKARAKGKQDELSLDRKRLQMENLIQKAKEKGVDTKFYERSLKSAKKIETIEKRRIELARKLVGLKKEAASVDKNTQKRPINVSDKGQAADLKKRFKGQIEYLTRTPSGNSTMSDYYKSLEQEQQKRGKNLAQENKFYKQLGILDGSDPEIIASQKAFKDYYKELEKEQKAHIKRSQTQKNKGYMNQPSRSLFEKNQAARVKDSDYELARDQFARQKVDQLKRSGVANAESYREQARAAFGLRGATAKLNNDIREQIDLQRRNRMQIQKTNIAMQGLNDSTRHMIRSYASLYAITAGTGFIIKTGQDFERMEAGMLAASSSAEIAEENLQFLRKESMRLGFDLATASKAFVKLAASAEGKASMEEIREMFVGVTEASTVFQLSMDDTVGTIRAMQQMFAKGQIMREEFKNQLGDRLPIALRALELSTGKTSEQLLKMMEAGQLGVEYIPEFAKALGKLARENGALEKATNSSQKAQDRFFNTVKIGAEAVYKGDMEEAYVKMLNSVAKFITENEDALKGLGQGFALLFNAVRVGLSLIMPIIDAFTYSLGEVAELFNFLFFGSTEKELLAIGAATYVIVKAVRAMNAALKTQIGLRAASILLNPAALAAVTGALVAEDTLKGAQDRNANTAFNAGTGLSVGNVWHFLTAGFTEDGYSGFFENYANKVKAQMSPAISLEVKTEEGLDVKVRNIVTQNNAEAKVEVN